MSRIYLETIDYFTFEPDWQPICKQHESIFSSEVRFSMISLLLIVHLVLSVVWRKNNLYIYLSGERWEDITYGCCLLSHSNYVSFSHKHNTVKLIIKFAQNERDTMEPNTPQSRRILNLFNQYFFVKSSCAVLWVQSLAEKHSL